MTFLNQPLHQFDMEPNANNISQWMQNLYTRSDPWEKARWNQSNIDTLCYAGNQSMVGNQSFGGGYMGAGSSNNQYYFNIIQQPVNLVTGYQRQHRKSIMYQAIEGADNKTTDQYTKLIQKSFSMGNMHEQFSKACELATISGMVMIQPYLDYSEDAAQGSLRLKIWEFSSFLTDSFFRSPDMSDASYVWCQEYISRQEAVGRFGEKAEKLTPMTGSPNSYGKFYFLPESYYMGRNDLFVLSYIWYKTNRRKERLYSEKMNQFFDFSEEEGNLEQILQTIPDLQVVNVEIPTWELATVLNDQLMFKGQNPLKFDRCPMIPVFWNYDPHISQPDLRVRSLVRTMRSSQYLFNYKVITNNDIAAATINAGWKRKSGAVANEDNLKKSGQGWDVIINDGYEMTDCEKIIPSAVPESDLALAQQLEDLMFKTSGVQMENWAGQQDKQISSLTMLQKMAANLLVFQKYFDQWDLSLKLLGELTLDVALNNWNAAKVQLMINEEPEPNFYSKIFAKYHTVVEECDLTPTQQNLQAQHMLDVNQLFGREVFPPSMIIPKLNITGKGQIIPYLQEQEQQMAAVQSEETNLKHTVEEMKLKELMAKIHNQLSQARERDSRSESNVGLFEERMSMISKNHALAAKEKMAALEQLLETIQKFGEVETFLKSNELESIKYDEEEAEKSSRQVVERNEASKRFMEQLMSSQPMTPQPQQQM